jgi:heat shock protein HslJ
VSPEASAHFLAWAWHREIILRSLKAFLLIGCLVSIGSSAYAADEIAGPTWLVESVTGAGTIDTGQTQLVIAADGRVSTTVGCNRIAGSAKIDGDKLSFGPLISTRKACAPALMDAEQKYMTALAAVRSFRIEGTMMTFAGEAGTALITFARGK